MTEVWTGRTAKGKEKETTNKIPISKNNKALLIRKLVHLLTGLLILLLSYSIGRNVLLLLIIGGSIFSFATFRHKSFQLVHRSTHNSFGTLFYPLGILSSFLLLADLPLFYFQTALMV